MLIPSTRHALRTRKYMSTMYILVTFHQSLDRLYRKVTGGTVFDRHDQAVEPPSRYIIFPPFSPIFLYVFRLLMRDIHATTLYRFDFQVILLLTY